MKFQAGLSFLEVLIAILLLTFGLMASHLIQGRITDNMAQAIIDQQSSLLEKDYREAWSMGALYRDPFWNGNPITDWLAPYPGGTGSGAYKPPTSYHGNLYSNMVNNYQPMQTFNDQTCYQKFCTVGEFSTFVERGYTDAKMALRPQRIFQ